MSNKYYTHPGNQAEDETEMNPCSDKKKKRARRFELPTFSLGS
jgi:hypothetical protein